MNDVVSRRVHSGMAMGQMPFDLRDRARHAAFIGYQDAARKPACPAGAVGKNGARLRCMSMRPQSRQVWGAVTRGARARHALARGALRGMATIGRAATTGASQLRYSE